MLPGAKLLMSPHGKWLASFGVDGYVQLRAVGSLVSTLNLVSKSSIHQFLDEKKK